MARRIVPNPAVLAVLAVLAGAATAEPPLTAAQFDVEALGFKVGELTLAGRTGASDYAAEARFATTGVVRLIRDMGFVMQADGRRSGPTFAPLRYSEQVDTGNRQSSARMDYVDGTPHLVGGEVRDGEVEPLDPAGETGTVDPLTVMFMTLRDQPAAGLCRTDQLVFDGGRRIRVRLTGRTEAPGEVICSGQIVRVAGYPERDLRTRRVVPVTVTYTPGDDGLMRARSALVRTDYGPAGIVRRD